MTFEEWVRSVHPDIEDQITDAVENCLAHGKPKYDAICLNLGEDGSVCRRGDCSPGDSLLFEAEKGSYGNHPITNGTSVFSLTIGSFHDLILAKFAERGWVAFEE